MPITAQHAKSNTIADWSGTITVGNSTGGTSTAAASDLVRPSDWNSAHNITLNLTGSEIASLFNFGNGLSSTTNGAGITVGLQSEDFHEPFRPFNTNSSLSAPGIGTWYIDHANVPYNLGSGQFNVLMADAAGFKNGAVYTSSLTGSVTRNQTINNQICLYTEGSGANSTRLESYYSMDCSVLATWARSVNSTTAGGGTTTGVIITNALTLSFPAQWNSTGGVTYSSTAQSGTTSTSVSTAASTFADNLITGAIAYLSGSRQAIFPFATTLAAGIFWVGHMLTSTSSSAGTNYSTGTMFSTQSLLHNLEFVGQAFKRLGLSASDSSSAFQRFHGSLATTTSSPTSRIATSDLRNLATNARMYWNYAVSSY